VPAGFVFLLSMWPKQKSSRLGVFSVFPMGTRDRAKRNIIYRDFPFLLQPNRNWDAECPFPRIVLQEMPYGRPQTLPRDDAKILHFLQPYSSAYNSPFQNRIERTVSSRIPGAQTLRRKPLTHSKEIHI
jgi:hypothetical protein